MSLVLTIRALLVLALSNIHKKYVTSVGYKMKNVGIANVSNAFPYCQQEYALKSAGYYIRM